MIFQIGANNLHVRCLHFIKIRLSPQHPTNLIAKHQVIIIRTLTKPHVQPFEKTLCQIFVMGGNNNFLELHLPFCLSFFLCLVEGTSDTY
ncbi:diphthine--ammonia ligase-like isoform X1 [Gossypium australe]|uniref:Diphthine--ammonia ligase-like isoform X1 n=1 Tax=Gossypium australe TaxID=47621 RepID=A0A5B6VVT7_9ROSI|nr:diphthine--ammonia ligase-like isoform X1 [Gossypium australe]